MRITIERDLTVKELLDDIQARYGSRAEIEDHLDDNPRDWDAKVALHDLQEYQDTDPSTRIEDTREIVLPDRSLDELTSKRLSLLLTVKQAGGEVEGLRNLSRRVDRDVKNVSDDVTALRGIGLLEVRKQGPGLPHLISLPGQRIDLHLVEAGA